tara:strand:+ start:4884 stop:5651 length:768 start_codon:yes stop_codon:yes gene_type:complete
MIKLFKNIRKNLLVEGKTTNYLKYAIGEIILVVIGILIALSINNQNDARKQRSKELHYLANIKSDLIINNKELDKYTQTRTMYIANANHILENFEGKPITNLSDFNALCVPIYGWKRFYQTDNTYQELTNSGNLALISNDSIKNTLLNIDTHYKILKAEEDHFRFDTENLIYQPLYALMDLNPLVNNYAYRVSNGQSGKNTPLSKVRFDEFLKNSKLKNGFVMAVMEFDIMNGMMNDMKEMSENLIKIIDSELKK